MIEMFICFGWIGIIGFFLGFAIHEFFYNFVFDKGYVTERMDGTKRLYYRGKSYFIPNSKCPKVQRINDGPINT